MNFIPQSKVIRRDILDLICEFLETWLHQILYQCELYPRAVFKLHKKFEAPVHIAVHPCVREYLSQFVQSCHSQLEKGNVKLVSLTVLEDDSKTILEKFVFEIHSAALRQSSLPISSILESESIYSIADLEQHLRACLIKINTYESLAKKKNGNTFSLSIETFDQGYPDLDNREEDIEWLPVESEQEQNWKHLVPLKTVSVDLFRFNTYVKVASKKGKERCP
ncbi:MAG: DNA-binding protein [Benjaminiella poitrasii]|nr:MAG: DNA-binding protein [Benjaminiella poitrasii]